MDDTKIHILQGDITKCATDAIVNAANSTLLGGGGVDGAIHAAAGRGLYEECYTLGGCDVGEAKITAGYNLPCKHVIHTVGPIWRGGVRGEQALLENCYKNSMRLAIANGLESIVFPLISSGAYGYPLDGAITTALDALKAFVGKGIEISLILYDRYTYDKAIEIMRNS